MIGMEDGVFAWAECRFLNHAGAGNNSGFGPVLVNLDGSVLLNETKVVGIV